MRKASRVLGIVGGSLSLGMALLIGLIMLGIASLSSLEFYDDSLYNMNFAQMAFSNTATDPAIQEALKVLLLSLICSVVSGALGITAGVMVYKKRIAAGVMLIVAAGASCYFNFVAMICLLLAAIFAFVKEKPKPVYPYYPYPYYPYYTPYGTPAYGAPQGQYPQPPYMQMPYGQPYYGQPPYGQPPYPAQPPYTPQPPVSPVTPEAPSTKVSAPDAQTAKPEQPQS